MACFHWEKDCRQKTTHLFQFHQLFRNPLTKAFLKDEEFVQKKLGPGEIVPPSLDVTPLILADDNKRRKNLADDTPLWIVTTKKHCNMMLNISCLLFKFIIYSMTTSSSTSSFPSLMSSISCKSKKPRNVRQKKEEKIGGGSCPPGKCFFLGVGNV